jgi:hypothetical protein
MGSALRDYVVGVTDKRMPNWEAIGGRCWGRIWACHWERWRVRGRTKYIDLTDVQLYQILN